MLTSTSSGRSNYCGAAVADVKKLTGLPLLGVWTALILAPWVAIGHALRLVF